MDQLAGGRRDGDHTESGAETGEPQNRHAEHRESTGLTSCAVRPNLQAGNARYLLAICFLVKTGKSN